MLVSSILVVFIAIFIFAASKIHNEQLSMKKFLVLVLLPPILVGIWVGIHQLYTYPDKLQGAIVHSLFMIVAGFITMLPSLMLYAVFTLSLEKKFSLSSWKLFIVAGALGGVSASPYLISSKLDFLIVPIVSATLSMIIVYFYTKRKN